MHSLLLMYVHNLGQHLIMFSIFKVINLIAREVAMACRLGVEVTLSSRLLVSYPFQLNGIHSLFLPGGNSCWESELFLWQHMDNRYWFG